MNLIIKPRFCLILIAVMLIIFSVSFGFAFRDLHVGREKLAQAEAAHAELEAELQQLRDTLAFTETDEYIERVARDELGLMMPGEIRYMAVE